MYVLVVTIDIKPGYKETFLAEMLDDARGSVRDEPGCVRFDVIQDEKEPNRLYLYETYKDRVGQVGIGHMPLHTEYRQVTGQ